MDDLLKEFLIEAGEQIDAATSQIVALERDSDDLVLIASIFRLIHTIKGTCGFLGLARLQRVAHAAESLIGALRDGAKTSPAIISAILAAADRIKAILAELEETGGEGAADDSALILLLEDFVARCKASCEEPPAAPPIALLQAEAVEGGCKIVVAPPPTGEGAGGKRAETIRIKLDALERIMQLVSELVLNRNQLLELTRQKEDETLKSPLQRLSSMTSDLQDAVMRARMQPVERVFANLPRIVRDLATELNKKINLVTEGGDTELDRQLIELIRDPLTHLVRNCADHGVEPPEERIRQGKPATGTVRVSASHEAGQITIEIADDGRGLDRRRIEEKALALGLVDAQQLQRMSEEEIYRFIFAPGFSTATRVTNVSGRGVGMDVVRENIQAIGGSVALSSTPGRGSCFALKIPLTLAIAPALIVESAGQRFALPQIAVVEAVGLRGGEHRIEVVQGARILQLREAVLPIASLADLLRLDPPAETAGGAEQLAVVLRAGAQSFGITVDAVTDVQEIVVKPMSGSLQHLAAFSGHTILGDGSVVLILDPNGLREALGLESSRDGGSAEIQGAAAGESDALRLIQFRAGSGLDKVLPLSNVARIDTVSVERIERSGGQMLMRRQDRLTPVVAAAHDVTLKDGDNIIFIIEPHGEPFGLLVDSVVDIVEDRLEIEALADAPGIVGAANLRGKVVELLDIAYFVEILGAPASAPATARKRRLLLVDDAAFFRDMLAATLQAAGFDVIKLGSSAQALAFVAQNGVFDAALIDVDLPDGAGFDLAVRLRDGGARAPAIALAPFATREILRKAEAAGMAGAVGKFQRNQLLDLLRACFDAEDRTNTQVTGAAA